jgi:hypothetical protein
MGFRVRIAPGIRVGISSRGVRTSVGPRIARVHVGAGRTGFSSGIGPISYYKSVGGSSSSRTSNSSSNSYSGASSSGFRSIDSKEHAKFEIQAILAKWTRAHEQVFAPTQRQIAPLEETESLESLYSKEKPKFLTGINFFKFKERKAAKLEARKAAEAQKKVLEDTALAKQATEQKEFDKVWDDLNSGDSSEIYTHLTDAFEDNSSKSAVIDIEKDTVSLIVLVPDVEALPEYDWSYTAAGNLSVRKMTVTARNTYYYELIASQCLATANEAFAVAPSINTVTIIVIRARDSHRTELGADCISFVTIERSKLATYPSQKGTQASLVLEAVSHKKWNITTNAKMGVIPINLRNEPDIAKVLKALEFGDVEHAEESKELLGVSVSRATAVKSSSVSKPRSPKEPQSYAPMAKPLDIDLEVRAMDIAISGGFLTPSILQEKLGLTDAEALQMIEFLVLVGVVKSKPEGDKFATMATSENRAMMVSDIHGSISFRRM